MLPAPTTIAISTPRSRDVARSARRPRASALGIGAVVEVAHQRLAGELQQDAVEGRARRYCHAGRATRRPRSARSAGSRRSRRSSPTSSARSCSIVLPSCLSALTCSCFEQHDLLEPLVELALDDLRRGCSRACRRPAARRCASRRRWPPRGTSSSVTYCVAGCAAMCSATSRANADEVVVAWRRSRCCSRPRRARRSCRWRGCRLRRCPRRPRGRRACRACCPS